MDLLADVLDQFAASHQEVQEPSDSVQAICTMLPRLIAMTDKSVDANPLTRRVVATGLAPLLHSQFALEGKAVLSAVFAGSFKRCALLWKLLLKEFEASSCPQRLLLKLGYCQGFCIRAFNSSPVDTKRLLVSENAASITFGLDLSIAVLQGHLSTEPNQWAATMISFFQQFDQYLPYDTATIPPSCCQEVLTRLTVTTQHNKHKGSAAMILILTTVLHCVSNYGWDAAVGDIDLETLLMTTVHSHIEKLSIISKALLVFMPGMSGVEVLLKREQLSLIVKQLSTFFTTGLSASSDYSIRELLAIMKAITRVQDNCTGLLEEGVEKVLGALMEQGDETTNAIAAEITCRIASGGVNTDEEAMERSSSERSFKWGYDSFQAKDPDGTITFVDIILHQLAELIFNKSWSDLSVENRTIETLILTVFDIHWQSEVKLKEAVAEMIGDKYMQFFCDLDPIVTYFVLQKNAAAAIVYNQLIQEFARRSAYFCEKAYTGGLIHLLLVNLQHFVIVSAPEYHLVILDYRLTVLFHCAHRKAFISSEFGIKGAVNSLAFIYSEFGTTSAINSLACVLQSPTAQTRLLARLVICCFLPILEDHRQTLLEMTDDESQLLLTYVKEVTLPGGLDTAKFLMAASILFSDVCPRNASGPLAITVADNVVQQISKQHDKCILEGTLCLLWTLCYTPAIVQRLSQIDHLIPELKTMQQTECSTVSSLAKCVLWKLGCGNYEDNDECYQYACTCLHYGQYTECIEHCDHIMTTATSSLHGMVRQLRGKSFAHLHQKQFCHIRMQGSLDVAVPLKGGNAVDQCAISAKKAVKDLGFALDCRVLDEEGSYLMDVTMLHYAQIKNQLEDCNRCLLCRRRGVKLKGSHTCPKFVLKVATNKNMERLQELSIAEAVDRHFHSISGRFAAYTPKTATCAMLCGRCEQVLSQNGEDQFMKDIMPLLYSANDEVQTAKYNSTLYSFCLGIVFRFFVKNSFTTYCNASEIYSLFVTCRNHLLSLPVKYSESEYPNLPPPATTLPMSPVEVFLFPSPSTIHINNSKLLFLAASMTNSACLLYLTTPLSTEPKSTVSFCHALVARLCSFSIVVPFSPAQGGFLDESCRINSHGGDYQVLPDIRRWETMPSGLLQVFVLIANAFEKQRQQIVSGMKTTKKDSKKADAFVDTVALLTNTLQQPTDANSLRLLPPKEEELISMFLSKSLVPVKMLPESFDVKSLPPEVILKEGYILLHHIYNEKENATFFFAANAEDLMYGKLVVIMKYKEDGENFERVESVNIHIREDNSNYSFCVTGFLQGPATENLKKTQHSRHRVVSEKIKKALNVLVQKCGSLEVFLHHARLQMRMNNNPCIDKRCSSGCWYCMDRCHICMKPVNRAYTSIFPAEKLMLMHCSAECKAIVDSVSQFSMKLHPVTLLVNKHLVLASIKGCLASVMSTRTVVQVNICISIERSLIMFGRPYATVQLQTHEQSVLFSVYLCDDLSPTQPVDGFPTAFPFQMLIESNLLTEIFRKSLHSLEIFSISHLLRNATKADVTLSKMFSISCSPYERKLCSEEIVPSQKLISQEGLFTSWMVKELLFVCEDKEEILQLSSSENLSQVHLSPSCGACYTLFWTYIQLSCLLWKRVLNGSTGLLLQKTTYITQITIKLYEQSPTNIQKYIANVFSSSAEILQLCCQIALTAIKGGLPPRIHESVVQLLLLAYKFIAMVRTATEPMNSILVRHLYEELEEVKQDDVQRLTEVSAVAQQLLLTLMLKSHICGVGAGEAVPIQPFLNSPFTFISIMAKAVAVSLLQGCPQAKVFADDTKMTEKEINFLSVKIHGLSEDILKRRYLFNLILQALSLLCSQPVNVNQLASHSIVTELQALMEYADELEDPDIIANVLWKIAGGGSESTTDTIDTFEVLTGEETPEIDICLDVEQGLCHTADKLLMIIYEFCSIYLECEHVHESHSVTVFSVAQLLYELHQIMDRKERETVSEFLSQNPSILLMLLLAVSKHRKSWLHCSNGIHIRGTIESLFVTWTDCSEDLCQAVAGSGVLIDIANSLHWALEHEELNSCDIVCLQSQVLMIYNVAQKCPQQTAFDLQLTCLQPLLNCSLLPIQIISKSIVVLLAGYWWYIDTSAVATLFLTHNEVRFFSDSFASFINSGEISTDDRTITFSVEELLFSLQKLSSLPCDKSCCALPCLLDALLALSSYDDKTIATSALEVLWNIAMEPTVALAILCHENLVCALQKMSLFSSGLADISRSILWILGYGNTEDIIGCSEYADSCYKFGKYTEAISWCDHVLHIATTMHPILPKIKSCKGKALAKIYLQKQLHRLQKSDQWALLGYDNNLEKAESLILDCISSHPSAIDNELLSQLSFADLQNWKSLCSQGQQAIELLGEALDSDELDEQGSELLDWVMMDYYRESGEVNDCKRCLLCRNIGKLVRFTLRSTPTEGESLTSESILSLHSFMHFEQLPNILMFCKECELILSTYSDKYVQSFLNETKRTYDKPVKYERALYLHLIAKLAQKLPLAYTGYCSNWKDIHNTFVACRQILLSHDIYNSTIYYPKIYLFNNPNMWYVYTNPSSEFCSFSSSKDITAMIANEQLYSKRGSSNQFLFLMMHTECCTIVAEFYSEKECVQLPSQYLINPAGGSYPIPHVSEQWEAFPQELIQSFHNLVLADERRSVCQHILRLEGTDSSNSQQPFSRSTRCWVPKKFFISFLPEEFSLEVDSDAIRNIYLPDGHKILFHSNDQDKNLTVFLAYATNSMCRKKQFYFIFTCKLHDCFIADGVFLNGDVELFSSSIPVMFKLGAYLPVDGKVMTCIYKIIFQKFPLLLDSLKRMFTRCGLFGFEAVSSYEDITRNANLAVSVDKSCSPEGCWYCHHRCHSCMKPASVGYTWKEGDSGQLFYHCSNRCYHMYTGNIPESTILDVKVGEIHDVPAHGAHLLLSATVTLETGLSTNRVASTQVAISYGSKKVPEGVYVIPQVIKINNHAPAIAFFIQHDLTPVTVVWEPGIVPFSRYFMTSMTEMVRKEDLIKQTLQPAFDVFGCKDLPSFLEKMFPLLDVHFMDSTGAIYSWPPSGEHGETSTDSLMEEGGGSDCLQM